MKTADEQAAIELTEYLAKVLVGHSAAHVNMAVANLLAGCAVTVDPQDPHRYITNIAAYAIDIIDLNEAEGIPPRWIRKETTQ
jgi:hypothetical protein